MAAARDDAATVTSPADFERFQGLTVTHKFLPNEHARIILCCKCLQRSEETRVDSAVAIWWPSDAKTSTALLRWLHFSEPLRPCF